ncbi:MAG: adenylate/guanylate cyclase domain-containing protein [Fulvivirga sp.]
MVWSIVTALTQFSLQINDKFGQGLLLAFISGKYHSPRQENRVFMFLDLMSSTQIAEKLGNTQYYNLLRDFYADITNSIIYNGGEIYQYVGDEVVISWRYEIGVLQNKCITYFYDIRSKITAMEDKYQIKYNLLPDFKAALHYGNVTAGEIGIIKRDIAYSGDVLNTTSRILSKCNEFKEKLLISGKLFSSL